MIRYAFLGNFEKKGRIVIIRGFVEGKSIERTIVVEERKHASGL
jgi:hypothetical protein